MDLDPEAARRAAGDTPAVTSIAELLDLEPEAVFVSTPTHCHEEACLAAFEKGCHVLCEKPLSHTLESARRIHQAAATAGRVLAVGFNHRYYPSMAFVRETVKAGKIGELDHLRIFGGHDGLANFKGEWQYRTPESGGGAMWDVGIHMTDLARYLLGEITDVYGVASERVWELPGSEDNALAIFRNAAGIPAIYQATWTEWKGYHVFVEAYGSLGMVRGYYAPMRNLLITQERPGGPRKTVRKLYPEIMVREKLKTWQSTTLRTFEEELEDFLALCDGKPGVRIADGAAGVRAIEIAEAVKTSTASREAVHLDAIES